MKNILFLFISLFSLQLSAQEYSRVHVYLGNNTIQQVQKMGLDLDHFHMNKPNEFETDLSRKDLKVLDDNGIRYSVLIKDVQQFYVDRNKVKSPEETATIGCEETDPLAKYIVPTDFALGSMGGYLTYQQFLGHIDNMSTKYPNLITVKQPIDTFLTHEGRPIYWLKISDNPNVDESEPELLYTALHHAREPISLSQLIFYMYYVLENYNTNPKIKALVDNLEMYFVPMLNPDGYNYNQTTNPNGGGMWRKNRRNNLDGTFGVDLNRNYSYQWGGLGASANTNDDTYRGSSAFSEPETQAIQFFVENHLFNFAFNYHTYSDLLLYPYGYDVNKITPDDAYFKAFTPVLVSENHFANILTSELYPAAGDSDDWMYGDSTKNKVFAMTPEVGSYNDGFWPQTSRIITLCQKNILANLTLAELNLHYGYLKEQGPKFVSQTNNTIQYSLQQLGLDTVGTFTVSIIPLTANIMNVGNSKIYTNLSMMQTEIDSISYTLSNFLLNNEKIQFILKLNNGLYDSFDTITKYYLNPNTIVFSDDASDLSNWTSNTWGPSPEKYYSASTSITDSPFLNYPQNTNTTITFNNTLDLSVATNAFVTFNATWFIENDYDYVQFQALIDGGPNWIPLCGNYTNLGSSNQDFNEPLYDGDMSWVNELIDLHSCLGHSNVKLRFSLVSDPFIAKDGFYFDDFKVFAAPYIPNVVSENKFVKKSIQVYPNPSENGVKSVYIAGLDHTQLFKASVYNTLGEVIQNDVVLKNNTLDVSSGLKPGLYHIIIKDLQDKTIGNTQWLVK